MNREFSDEEFEQYFHVQWKKVERDALQAQREGKLSLYNRYRKDGEMIAYAKLSFEKLRELESKVETAVSLLGIEENERLKGEIAQYKEHEEFKPPITCVDCCSVVKKTEEENERLKKLLADANRGAERNAMINQQQVGFRAEALMLREAIEQFIGSQKGGCISKMVAYENMKQALNATPNTDALVECKHESFNSLTPSDFYEGTPLCSDCGQPHTDKAKTLAELVEAVGRIYRNPLSNTPMTMVDGEGRFFEEKNLCDVYRRFQEVVK